MSKPKAACLLRNSMLDGVGTHDTYLRSYVVINEIDLETSFGMDNKISASYLSFGGSVSSNIFSSQQGKTNNVYIVTSATTAHDSRSLAIPLTLTPDAERLRHLPTEFSRLCGTRFAYREERGSIFHSVITIRFASSVGVNNFISDLELRGGSQEISGSIKSKIDDKMKRIVSSGLASVEVKAPIGGDGFGALGNLIKLAPGEIETLSGVEAALATSLASFTSENPGATGYWTKTFEEAGLVQGPSYDLWSDAHFSALRTIGDVYRRVAVQEEGARAVLVGNHPLTSLWRADGYLQHRQTDARDVLDTLSNIRQIFDKCKEGGIRDPKRCEIDTPITYSDDFPGIHASVNVNLTMNMDAGSFIYDGTIRSMLSDAPSIDPEKILKHAKSNYPNLKQFRVYLEIRMPYGGTMDLVLIEGAKENRLYSLPFVRSGLDQRYSVIYLVDEPRGGPNWHKTDSEAIYSMLLDKVDKIRDDGQGNIEVKGVVAGVFRDVVGRRTSVPLFEVHLGDAHSGPLFRFIQ